MSSIHARRRTRLRTVRVTVRDLPPERRALLVGQLHDIYRMTSEGLDRQDFQAEVLPREDTRLGLFHAADAGLVGFSYATIYPFTHEGRPHAIFSAGVFFHPDFRGGSAAARFGLTEALRFKLTSPGTTLAYLSRACSPAPYLLFARTMDRFYPHRRHETTPAIESLVRAAARARGLTHVDDNLWVVHCSIAVPRRTSVRGAEEHERGQELDRRFYLHHNPGFAAGPALLVYMPLDLQNLMSGLWRAARNF